MDDEDEGYVMTPVEQFDLLDHADLPIPLDLMTAVAAEGVIFETPTHDNEE